LIDTKTRDALIAADPKAENIIKPYVRGQDFVRWRAPWNGTWMIFARRGIAIDDYPSVKRHLMAYRAQLEPRPEEWKPTGADDAWPGRKSGNYAWYEIQDTVDYWPLLEKPKILYPDIAWTPSFSIDRSGLFMNNTGYFIPTGDPWIAATLNAPIGWWFAWRRAQHGKDEALRYFNTFLESYPIPPKPKCDVGGLVQKIEAQASALCDTQNRIANWLKHEWEIENISRKLSTVVRLDAEAFLNAVRDVLPSKRRLTAAQIDELRREHAVTIGPARKTHATLMTLERELSDMVNAAYGLSPQEVALMWRTAPPRIPLSSNGEAISPDSKGNNGHDDV
jgi:hypothetical protein